MGYAPLYNSTSVNLSTPSVGAQRVLFVGQMETTGTATSKILEQNVNLDNVKTLFDPKSYLTDSIKEFININNTTTIDAIGIETSIGGAEAQALLTFSGAATNSGTLNVSIVKKKSGTAQFNKGNAFVSVVVEDTDTNIIVATKIFDALQLVLTSDDPIAITDDSLGELTIDSLLKGNVANSWYLQVDGLNLIGGLTLVTTRFAGGSASFSFTLEEFKIQIKDKKYDVIIWVNNELDVGILQSTLEERFNIKDNSDIAGVGLFPFYAATKILLENKAAAFPSNILSMISDKQDVGKNSVYGTPTNILVANYGGLVTVRQEDNVSISNIMQNFNSDVQIGGSRTLGVPYHATICNNIPLSSAINDNDSTIDFDNTEKNSLRLKGVTLLQNDSSISKVTLGSTPTTNIENTNLYLEDVKIEILISSELFVLNQTKFKQVGFTNGEIPIDNNAFVTTSMVAEFLELKFFPSRRDLGLLDNSQSSIDLTSRTLTVTFDEVLERLIINFTTKTTRKLREIVVNMIFQK